MITACRCYRVGDVDLFSNHTDVTEFRGVLILLCYFNVVVQRRPERDILFTSFTSQSELQTQNDVSNKVIGNRTKSLQKDTLELFLIPYSPTSLMLNKPSVYVH